ncbi:hypothetical protein V2J09_023199 [Rumex salicifolius]
MATSVIHCEFDRAKELKEFDDMKSGVKGLVDAGVNTVPRIFINQPDELSMMSGDDHFQVPIIDLQDIQSSGDRRSKIIKQILDASESWGFFQLVNHGIPLDLLDRLIQGARLFHEQDPELKKLFYSRDPMKMVKFNSNYDLFRSNIANWRDTLTVLTQFTGHLDPTELPNLCRDVILEYASEASKLADSLLDLMSEGLGLTSAENQLGGMECTKGWASVYHYYPSCPAPDVTLGATKHTDPSFLTVLLQDEIGGLQVLHQNKWVNVHPVPGALVINIGDLLQMISNDKMKSVEHRVVANRVGPRISAAMFFNGLTPSPRIYSPVQELVSAENPALYKEFTLGLLGSLDLATSRFEVVVDGIRAEALAIKDSVIKFSNWKSVR